jgi:hypothetical protein
MVGQQQDDNRAGDPVQLPLERRKDDSQWANESPTTVGADSLGATPDRASYAAEGYATPMASMGLDLRQALSCPAVPFGAPPGLDDGRAVDGLPLEPPPLPLGDRSDETPSKISLPNYWPRTMSIDSMEDLVDVAHVRKVDVDRKLDQTPLDTPVKVARPTFGPADSPAMSCATPFAKVTLWPRTMSGDDLETMFGQGQTNAKFGMPPPPAASPPALKTSDVGPPPLHSGVDAAKSQVVSLASALPPEPEVGTPDCPTIGSRGHRLGTCKPCAFLHTKGCTNGWECAFCHLCSRGEKKRRQREKWQQQQQQQQVQVQQAQQHAQQAAAHQAAQHFQMYPPMLPMPGSPLACGAMLPGFPMPMAPHLSPMPPMPPPMPMMHDPMAVMSLAALSAGTF